MERNLLVIYNTCGIGSNENTDDYKRSIDSILSQDDVIINFDLAISSCLNSDKTICDLRKRYTPDDLTIVRINERWPVNATFNFTANLLSAAEKNYVGIMYIDSGVRFTDVYQLARIVDGWDLWGLPAIYSVSVDTDMGFDAWGLESGVVFKMPIGKAVNCHAQIFNKMYHDFYGGLLPDIFAGHCSESVLSFLAAAINDFWIHDGTVVLEHRTGVDKQSGGFCTYEWVSKGGKTWDHPFIIDSVIPRVASDRARELGLGYEELRGVSIHDASMFDDRGFAKSRELKGYIKNNLFLNRNELPYDSVNYEIL